MLDMHYIYKALSEIYDKSDVDESIRYLMKIELSFDHIENKDMLVLYTINMSQCLCKNDINPCLKSSIIIFVFMLKLDMDPTLCIGLIQTQNGIKAHAYVVSDKYETIHNDFILIKKYTRADFEVNLCGTQTK